MSVASESFAAKRVEELRAETLTESELLRMEIERLEFQVDELFAFIESKIGMNRDAVVAAMMESR